MRDIVPPVGFLARCGLAAVTTSCGLLHDMSVDRTYPPEGRLVRVPLSADSNQQSDLQVHVIERGTGPSVVYLHGNPGFAHEFFSAQLPGGASLVDDLTSRHHLVTYDRPGHGETPRSRAALSIEEQCRLLQSVVQATCQDRPILLAYSWGGALALAFAQAHPEDVSGVVLLAPIVYPDADTILGIARFGIAHPVISFVLYFPFTLGHLTFGGWPLGTAITRSEVEAAFAPSTPPPCCREFLDEATDRWSTTGSIITMIEEDQELWRHAMASRDGKSDLGYDLGDAWTRMVIVVGADDERVRPEQHGARLFEERKHAELDCTLWSLPGIGHKIALLEPGVVLQAIEQVGAPWPIWLNRTDVGVQKSGPSGAARETGDEP